MIEDWPLWARARIETRGDCLIWCGEYYRAKRICYHTRPDGKRVNVKLFLLKEEGDGFVRKFSTSCGIHTCLAQDHQEWVFRAL